MSERFKFASVCGDLGLYDKEKEECIIVNIRSNLDLQANWDIILDLLNRLVDENEQLRKANELLEQDNEQLRFIIQFLKERKKLEKENEKVVIDDE